jgi:POT family proton-dependent oligopeptide transporter
MPVAVDARPYDHAFFGHPRGLSVLFFTEMWERFSYYGMRALLILFMTAPVAAGGLGFETGVAGAVYGLYTSMVYMTSLPGGWIADRLIGQRRAVLYGGIIIACGHFAMAVQSLTTFYIGLALIVVGTGLLKGNAAVIVGALLAAGCPPRHRFSSTTWAQPRAFIAPLVCGYSDSGSAGTSASAPPGRHGARHRPVSGARNTRRRGSASGARAPPRRPR